MVTEKATEIRFLTVSVSVSLHAIVSLWTHRLYRAAGLVREREHSLVCWSVGTAYTFVGGDKC